MNQIFRITIGPETILGRLPSLRVGQGYCSLFHIAGATEDGTGISPKVWISKDGDTLFWTGEWDEDRGLWVVNVGSAISSEPGTYAYAITMANADGCQYIAGQGVFSVYSNIASGSGTSGDDEPGTSIMELVAALTMRVEALEAILTPGASLPMFDPESAFDIDMRNQVQAITNILRGTAP